MMLSLLNHIFKTLDLTDIQFKAMDADGDGTITDLDYTFILNFIYNDERVEL